MRTDLKELVDLDLEGHVYGYAPMGDDRQDMEGFRFWKTGEIISVVRCSRESYLTPLQKAIGMKVSAADPITLGEKPMGFLRDIG